MKSIFINIFSRNLLFSRLFSALIILFQIFEQIIFKSRRKLQEIREIFDSKTPTRTPKITETWYKKKLNGFRNLQTPTGWRNILEKTPLFRLNNSPKGITERDIQISKKKKCRFSVQILRATTESTNLYQVW